MTPGCDVMNKYEIVGVVGEGKFVIVTCFGPNIKKGTSIIVCICM